jgi:hypothetical protein
LGRDSIFTQRREGAVQKIVGAGPAQIPGGTKGHRVIDILSRAIHPGALRTVERHLLPIHGEKVLTKELTERFKQVTKTA